MSSLLPEPSQRRAGEREKKKKKTVIKQMMDADFQAPVACRVSAHLVYTALSNGHLVSVTSAK